MKKYALICAASVLLIIGVIVLSQKAEGASSAGYAGTAADNGGAHIWTSTSNATGAPDGSSASSVIAGAGQSNYINLTNFGFAIPVGATINGIAAAVRWTSPSGEETADDFSVKLIIGGTISGTDQATGSFLPIDPVDTPYGNSGNLWGLTPTVANVNASNFGIALAVNSDTSLMQVDLDSVQLTITYTVAATGQSGTAMMMSTDF